MKFVIAIRTEVSSAVYEVEALTEKEALNQAKKMTMAVTGLPSQAIHMTAYGPYIKIDPDEVIRVPLAIQDAEGNFARGRLEVTDTDVEIFMNDYPNAFFIGQSSMSMNMHNGDLLLVIWGDNSGNGPIVTPFNLLKWGDEEDKEG